MISIFFELIRLLFGVCKYELKEFLEKIECLKFIWFLLLLWSLFKGL